MPPKSYKKRRMNRKPRHEKKYRRNVATIARPLNVKPRSAFQNVTYYQSFNCNPALDSTAAAGSKQQNFSIELALNSLWPFESVWDAKANSNGRTAVANDPITPYSSPVTDSMTIMPNVKDGVALFKQYNNCAVVGTKVTVVATPLNNSAENQMGYLYAIKHSQSSTGLQDTSTITDLNKMPYRKMCKLQGANVPTSGFQVNNIVGGKLVITHSPKKFNNVADLRDNKGLFCTTGSNVVASSPTEGDYLTIGVVPALNGRDLPVTNFCLQIRVEMRLLWTEPLESLNTGAGNYSFPWTVNNPYSSTTAGLYTLGGLAGAYANYRRIQRNYRNRYALD